jgi:hypothetical protein
MGRKLLEALIVYRNIDVKANEARAYKAFNCQSLQDELTQNKQLIKMTMGEEGNSSGSDSAPSEDNLDEEELATVVPIEKKKKPEPPKKEEKKPPPKKAAPIIKKPSSPLGKRQPPVVKEISRSPTKRPFGYNPFDRLSIRKRKPEMKDAWTQTTPKSKEQLDKERKEYR